MASRTSLRPLFRSLCQARSPRRLLLPSIPTASRYQSSAATTPSQPRDHDGTTNEKPSERTTHFGYETVTESEKTKRVAGVFTSVAESYDRMNDLMSFGWHRVWKDHFVQSLAPALIPQPNSTRPLQLLDVAGGTGDIAFRLLRLAHTLHPSHGPDTLRLTMSDINPSMLSVGQSRAESQLSPTLQSHLSFLVADAQDLPRDVLPDNSVDLYTVAFGIRNFTDIRKGLAEAFRVLRPGGVFACLEFGKVTGPGSTYDSSAESLSSGLPFSGFLSTPPHRTLFDAVYKRWSFSAIPLIGQIVAGDRDSYQYLVESIERFPAQREFRDMIAEAGFDIPGDPGWEDLTAGVAAIHKGVKPLHA